jgi:hypothetical protein
MVTYLIKKIKHMTNESVPFDRKTNKSNAIAISDKIAANIMQ